MLLGVIADDFTGATDIAGFLVENGMRTIQLNGIPDDRLDVDVDAVVISLKSRSCPVDEAVNQSLSALNWLMAKNCQQFYFKYCSTFDSTAEGNIGPVTDALMSALGCDITIVCPALPINGRTVFNGHLFVLGELLNESGMRHHPVNPMKDSSLIRLMNQQSKGQTGLINYQQIEQGAEVIQKALDKLVSEGKRYAVVDAFNSSHLQTLGAAVKNLKLVTGGSGLAEGIAKNWANHLEDQSQAKLHGTPSRQKTVVLSGSCSEMTNRQVNQYKTIAAYFPVSVGLCIDQENYSHEVSLWVKEHLDDTYAPMVYATASKGDLDVIQQTHGAEAASQAVETFFSQLAHHLQEIGVKNFIVAGGETSGVVTQSLGVRGFHIGPQIAPGVPWVRSIAQPLSLALKSGNFGDIDFFKKAQEFYHE
ncbi:3-oxo-tetronate kinase [Endozoicomonas sp. SCSIO W0465]|uniref:3-oxo-tetronate kinase n=1 Tax=Endozoicomonas sp. SCSIO W0465 TaxID=2918516 RepID=UPI0020752F0F|nr:3-oxo-tetronate kinase [Endozoicomonas sp. SCSIO W0465]USE36208.1 four-carbon acid sugar kinase family protein [Endozoicomonas sp. SCSIO W0465]